MDSQAYYQSLVAQGYSPEDATKFTQQHYPGFGQAPTAPQPMVTPAPSGVVMQDSVISGNIHQSVMTVNNITNVAVANQSTNTSKGMRITNGIFGMIMSLALIGYSLLVIGMWAEVSEDIEEDMELLGFFADADDDVADFHDGIDSFLSTISYFYYAILLISFFTFIISIMQFLDKPWGTKALLGSTALLLILLLATGFYEASSFVEIDKDYENITGEPLGDLPSFFEVNGTLGGYCAGSCFALYGLLAYIGRPKSPPVQLVVN